MSLIVRKEHTLHLNGVGQEQEFMMIVYRLMLRCQELEYRLDMKEKEFGEGKKLNKQKSMLSGLPWVSCWFFFFFSCNNFPVNLSRPFGM